jgi:hypothetical protein
MGMHSAERTVQTGANSVTDKLFAAMESGDYSQALGSNRTVLLNYRDTVMKTSRDGIWYLEVICVLQPLHGSFHVPLEQTFRSSQLPVATISQSLETCVRLLPEIVFFGSFTPSIPTPFFKSLTRTNDQDFVRRNWRRSRQNVYQIGLPERSGCSLSIRRNALRIPSEYKLAWLVWLNDELVAFIDEHNNQSR